MFAMILLKWRLPFALPGGSLDLNWSDYVVFYYKTNLYISNSCYFVYFQLFYEKSY